MLHIILLILKIIGIILLVLLGIILLALIAILFVPIRYSIDANLYKSGYLLGVVSWFMHIFSLNIEYENGKTDKYINIFHIRTGLLFGKEEDLSEYGFDEENDVDYFEALNESIANEDNSSSEDYSVMLNNKEDVIELFAEENEIEDSNIESEAESDVIELFNEEIDSVEKTEIDDSDNDLYDEDDDVANKADKESKLDKLYRKISQYKKKFHKIKFKLHKICAKIKSVWNKTCSIKDFLQMDETKEAISFIKSQAVIVLKIIKPRRIKGNVHFGTGDPASTGKILGCIYMFYKNTNSKFIIEPDFDEAVIEGEVSVKGHFNVFQLLIIAIRVYRNENLKNTINEAKELKEDL